MWPIMGGGRTLFWGKFKGGRTLFSGKFKGGQVFFHVYKRGAERFIVNVISVWAREISRIISPGQKKLELNINQNYTFSMWFIDLGMGGCNSTKKIWLFLIIEILIQYMNIGGGANHFLYWFQGGNQYKNASSLSLVWPQFC